MIMDIARARKAIDVNEYKEKVYHGNKQLLR